MADADLLIQVVDASDADRDQHIAAVDGLLKELGLAEKPRLLVWNKVDRLRPEDADHLASHGGGFVVSALDRTTFGPLLLAVERALWREGKALSAPLAYAG
jgi:GTP-binding protein HflX